jgi:hypothetical protein
MSNGSRDPEIGREGPSHRRRNLAFAFFGVAGGYFLLTEHYAHTLQALPWLLALACPLMHVFMHRGHGSEKGHGR